MKLLALASSVLYSLCKENRKIIKRAALNASVLKRKVRELVCLALMTNSIKCTVKYLGSYAGMHIAKYSIIRHSTQGDEIEKEVSWNRTEHMTSPETIVPLFFLPQPPSADYT